MERRRGAKLVLGTFAFFVKGRRAFPPTEEMTKQAAAELATLKPTSPVRVQRSKTVGLPESPGQPIRHGDQSEQGSPKFRVLLVEDNLVNRKDLPSSFDPPALIKC